MEKIDTPEELAVWLAKNLVPPSGWGYDEWRTLVFETFSHRHTSMLLNVLSTQHGKGAAYNVVVIFRVLGWKARLSGYGRAAHYVLESPNGGGVQIIHPNR